MKILTRTITNFKQGMTPNQYGQGFTRLEHFDTVTAQARPFRTLQLSTQGMGGGSSITTLALLKFVLMSGTNYAVGTDLSTPANGAIYVWDTTNFDWRGKLGFGTATVPNSMLFAHKGVLFGLQSSRYLYSMTTGGTYTSVQDLTAFTSFTDALNNTKDGCAYFATDNKIHKLSTSADGTAGTGYSLALTLPDANFVITSLCEEGDYINICGYNSVTGLSGSLLWDRDTSVVDVTALYTIGTERVYHNANLGGTTFFIQLRADTSNTPFQERLVLVVKYLSGGKAMTVTLPDGSLSEFPVESLNINSGRFGGKYVSNDRLYFTANCKLIGESAATNKCFVLNQEGRLSIAQNIGVDAGTNPITGILRDGEGFWFAGGSDGAWNTTTTYTTTSILETTKARAEDLSMNLKCRYFVITSEPLPSGGQIVLKARKNEETAWTTIKTYTTTNAIKHAVSTLAINNALNGLTNAYEVQFRIESTGGATLTGHQYAIDEVQADNIL